MKQIITVSALSFSLCLVFSCTKDNQSLNVNSAAKQIGSATGGQDGRLVLPSASHPDVAGDWISLKLDQVSNGSYTGLHSNYLFTNPLSSMYNLDRKFVFIRIPVTSDDPSGNPGADPVVTYSYRALPTDMMTSTGKVHFAYYLTSTSMDLGIVSINPSVMPNVDDFSNLQYRYFFVTASTYLNNSIDWTDYNAVVTVLNTAP